MLPAIDLDYEASFTTQEIADERTDRHLAGEFETRKLAFAEIAPQLSLG